MLLACFFLQNCHQQGLPGFYSEILFYAFHSVFKQEGLYLLGPKVPVCLRAYKNKQTTKKKQTNKQTNKTKKSRQQALFVCGVFSYISNKHLKLVVQFGCKMLSLCRICSILLRIRSFGSSRNPQCNEQ